jgi:hypothetical protein
VPLDPRRYLVGLRHGQLPVDLQRLLPEIAGQSVLAECGADVTDARKRVGPKVASRRRRAWRSCTSNNTSAVERC